MSLLYYERAFSNLRMNTSGGRPSPHKVAMMHAVLDAIEEGEISENKLFFSDALCYRFSQHLRSLGDEKDRNNPHLPFFHLRGDGFWHHRPRPGLRSKYAELTTVSGSGTLKQIVQFAYLDDALYELLSNVATRAVLRAALDSNLDKDSMSAILAANGSGGGAGGNGGGADWNWIECELIVADYFEMLKKHFSCVAFTKSDHLKNLIPKLNGRTKGSIEFKHGNISAILVEIGLPYLPGYKPAPNYQQQLKEVVFEHIAFAPDDFETAASAGDQNTDGPALDQIDWSKAYDPSPPEAVFETKPPDRQYIGRKTDFSKRELKNRSLGRSGEKFILTYEKHRLQQAGRSDLADEVQWSSEEEGDGLGFDIRSFNTDYDEELFIEVKTTGSGKYQPFFLSENERAFSSEAGTNYHLYRVYDFSNHPRFFILSGAIEKHVNLTPQQYKASFGGEPPTD